MQATVNSLWGIRWPMLPDRARPAAEEVHLWVELRNHVEIQAVYGREAAMQALHRMHQRMVQWGARTQAVRKACVLVRFRSGTLTALCGSRVFENEGDGIAGGLETLQVRLAGARPNDVIEYQANQTTVWATLGFTNASPTLSASYTLVDTTTVGNSALVLLKEVRNVTTGGAWGTSNQAKSGQVLEYRVTYTNTTTSPMTKVTIGDSAPSYTVFQSATAGTVPSDLGVCTMNTPANPAPAAAVGCATVQSVGGTGAIRWLFDGRLNPGASGDVGFKVKVE